MRSGRRFELRCDIATLRRGTRSARGTCALRWFDQDRKPLDVRTVDEIVTRRRGPDGWVTAWTISYASTLEPGHAEDDPGRASVVTQSSSRGDLRVIEEQGLPHYCRRANKNARSRGQHPDDRS
jgi:hypothetical protein